MTMERDGHLFDGKSSTNGDHTTSVGKGTRESIQRNPDLVKHIPSDRPFTAAVFPDHVDAHGAVLKLKNRGVIEKVDTITTHRPSKADRGTQKVAVWQATEAAVVVLEELEPVTDGPLPCGHESFRNVGVVEVAPTDEAYIACKRCRRMYPRGEL